MFCVPRSAGRASDNRLLWWQVLSQLHHISEVQEVSPVQRTRTEVLPRQTAGEADQAKKSLLYHEERRLRVDWRILQGGDAPGH